MTDAAFHALAEPHRRDILRVVRDQPRSVNEIAERFDITQQAVSQHLKVLREAGLVDVRRDGQRRLYVVRPEGLTGLRDFLAEFWPASLGRLKQAVEQDTRVELEHRDLPPGEQPGHDTGWRHYIARLAVAVSTSDAGPDPGMDDPGAPNR